MSDQVKNDAKQKMAKSIEALKNALAKLRTGRAHPSLLDQIRVDYYGTQTALSQVASVAVESARCLAVTPWEKTMLAPIEKAIMTSNLGLNPNTAGTVIHIPLPPLTEERRRDLAKIVKEEAEKARISVRNIRRDANTGLKELLKSKDISEDDDRRLQAEIQKVTDDHVAQIDKLAAEKESELMVV